MRGTNGALALVAALVVAACSGNDSPDGRATAVTDTTAATGAPTAPTGTGPSETTAAATPPAPTTATPTTSISTASSEPAADEYLATIRRTSDGVAHVSGDDLGDVAFGQGYANAEDHACTLADQVLKVQGRRAEAFGTGDGDENLNSDIAWRAIGIDRLARRDFREASADVIEAFDGYAAGWSAHLAEVGSDGLSGWCAGEDWVEALTGADVYAYARSIPLLASGGALTSFITTAQPPSAPSGVRDVGVLAAGLGNVRLPTPDAGSNAWAVGADRVTGGQGGLLVANPHFPWEGERRFWEVHLTIPGQLDIYGVQLIGVPGIGIGFTDSFAWSHTVSAGHRFTAYTLNLDPEDPTRYLVDGESRAMTSKRVTVRVREDDGTLRTVRRRMWSSEYGPIIDFPGFGWSDTATITYRDANIDNEEFADQYVAMTTARSFDEFVDAHRRFQGVPLFNTIATSSDGRAWYADTSATPNLSEEGEQLYLRRLESDPITQVAADNGAILLDGSDSRFAWEDVPGARDAGLVPFDELPMVERADYVFNANDSFWMPHASEMLEGEYSLLHGEQRTERSLRTRENAFVLSGEGAGSASGDDGTFTGEELRDASLLNMASSARLLREEVVALCRVGPVELPPLLGADDEEVLPAATMDLAPACDVLESWDGRYDLDSRGAVLWREMLSALGRDVQEGLGEVWAEPFDPQRPVATPAGLRPDEATAEAVRQALGRAMQTLAVVPLTPDVPLGEVQYALRADPRIPVHGGPGGDGLTNVVSYSDPSGTSEPMPDPGAELVPGSALRDGAVGAGGYPVDNGTSWLMTVDLTGDEPRAWVMLTYGETGDRESPLFDVQTQRFSDKDWREAAFTDETIAADPDLTEQTVTSE